MSCMTSLHQVCNPTHPHPHLDQPTLSNLTLVVAQNQPPLALRLPSRAFERH